MTRSKPSVPPPASSYWLPFVMIGVVGTLLGSTVTYLVLRPRLQQAPAVASTSNVPPDSSTHVPSPELTAGQLPAEADRTLGNFYYDHQNWTEAIRLYSSAIRQGIDNADIRTDLGNAYRFTGRTDDALAEYGRAQAMDPSHEFSLFNQGGLYLEDLKRPDKAVEIWNQYLVRFPAGRNVDAARQLIAKAQSGSTDGVARSTMPEKPASSSTEDLILKQIKNGQTDRAAPPAR